MDPENVKRETEAANARGEGFKADGEKLRWDLLPWEAVEDIVRVLTFGARKYADWNWVKVPNARTRYWAALLRHGLDWFLRRGTIDKESGLPLLAHAGCCLLFLAHLDKHPQSVPLIERPRPAPTSVPGPGIPRSYP